MKTKHKRHSKRITATRRWRALRLEIIDRDNGRCVQCGAVDRLEVDHIVAVRDDFKRAYDPTNLQTLCASCHTRKTRIECGHKPPDPRRTAWAELVADLERGPRQTPTPTS